MSARSMLDVHSIILMSQVHAVTLCDSHPEKHGPSCPGTGSCFLWPSASLTQQPLASRIERSRRPMSLQGRTGVYSQVNVCKLRRLERRKKHWGDMLMKSWRKGEAGPETQ